MVNIVPDHKADSTTRANGSNSEVSSENANLSDSTMLAFRCLGRFLEWVGSWPGKFATHLLGGAPW